MLGVLVCNLQRCARQNQSELLVAVTTGDVFAAHMALQEFADALQDRVARRERGMIQVSGTEIRISGIASFFQA